VGEKFYIILKGTVSVLVPQDKLRKTINSLVNDQMIKFVTQKSQKFKEPPLEGAATTTEVAEDLLDIARQSLSGSGLGDQSMDSAQQSSDSSKDKALVVDGDIMFKVIRNLQRRMSHYEERQQEVYESYFNEAVQLKNGKSFGELALINNKPRAATVKCLTDCHFAVLSKPDFEALLKKLEVKREKRFVDFLESLPFFSNQSRVALVKLKYLIQPRHYIKGQEVVAEDAPSSKIFIVKQGVFAVLKATDKFPVDQKAASEEKERLTLQKILDIQRKRMRGALKMRVIGNKEDEGERPSPGNSINSLIQNDLSGNRGCKKPKPALVTLIGPGELFGEYEALNEKGSH
jgi:CRP-like cAMP-binding protein